MPLSTRKRKALASIRKRLVHLCDEKLAPETALLWTNSDATTISGWFNDSQLSAQCSSEIAEALLELPVDGFFVILFMNFSPSHVWLPFRGRACLFVIISGLWLSNFWHCVCWTRIISFWVIFRSLLDRFYDLKVLGEFRLGISVRIFRLFYLLFADFSCLSLSDAPPRVFGLKK